MNFSLIFQFKCTALLFLILFVSFFLNKFGAECEAPKNVKRLRLNHNKNPSIPNVVNFKKRNENYCPNEYNMCFCDNTNINNQFVPMSKINGLKSGNHQQQQQQFSIMIDCRPSSKLNTTTTTTLFQIPKVISANSGTNKKFKYLQHITYLDLSNTEITEVPTDAFQGLNGLHTIIITNCRSLIKIGMFAFRYLPNLRMLILTDNPKLFKLEPHAFGSLRNLDKLSLSMNKLEAIDEYIFSASSSIKIIDFIGNPIRRIKSHAFHGLKNVSELLLSLVHHQTPIEIIEDDSFISTAFVDKIYLEAIPARQLGRNAFRGLSYCKHISLTNSYIEEIQANAFYHANHIDTLNLSSSRLRHLNLDSFRGMFNVHTIDLRGNYIKKLNRTIFEPILQLNLDAKTTTTTQYNATIKLIDLNNNQQFIVKKFLFEKNPIECDCGLIWLLNNQVYRDYVNLPEICAGPKGLDCIRINDLNVDILRCGGDEEDEDKMGAINLPCDDLEFDLEKSAQTDKEIISISASKGRKKTIDYHGNNNNNNSEDEHFNDEYEEDDFNHALRANEYSDENLPSNINQDIKSLFANSNPSLMMTTNEIIKSTMKTVIINKIFKTTNFDGFRTTTTPPNTTPKLKISKQIIATTSKIISSSSSTSLRNSKLSTLTLKNKNSQQPSSSFDNQNFNHDILLPNSGTKSIDNHHFLLILNFF